MLVGLEQVSVLPWLGVAPPEVRASAEGRSRRRPGLGAGQSQPTCMRRPRMRSPVACTSALVLQLAQKSRRMSRRIQRLILPAELGECALAPIVEQLAYLSVGSEDAFIRACAT